MSRTEPRFHPRFLDNLKSFDGVDGWSFFGLNGCPIQLIFAMRTLAKLASIYKTTTQMEWTIFDRTPVDAVIREVKAYVNEEKVEWDELDDLEDDVDARRNRYYCVEAWRHAIWLYACRVFKPTLDDGELRTIDYLSRYILDCARCIPSSSMIQKQILLPIFLAATERGDAESRNMVRSYCAYWSEKSRTYHFDTAGVLLERIWKDWYPSTRSHHWWGSKVDRHGWMEADGTTKDLTAEVLLG